MGLLDIFRKDSKPNSSTTDNGVIGPTFFDGLTEHIQNPKDLHSHEWRRQLKTASGQTKFKIKFYGQLHEDHKNLIVRTGFAPSLVFAVDVSTGQKFYCLTVANTVMMLYSVTHLQTIKLKTGPRQIITRTKTATKFLK